MVCKKCNFQNPSGMSCCGGCGASLYEKKPQKKKWLIVAIVLAVVLVAGIIIGVMVMFSNKDEDDNEHIVEENGKYCFNTTVDGFSQKYDEAIKWRAAQAEGNVLEDLQELLGLKNIVELSEISERGKIYEIEVGDAFRGDSIRLYEDDNMKKIYAAEYLTLDTTYGMRGIGCVLLLKTLCPELTDDAVEKLVPANLGDTIKDNKIGIEVFYDIKQMEDTDAYGRTFEVYMGVYRIEAVGSDE